MARRPILLDISRTLARARLPAPTGIDRVEAAYIDWALGQEAWFLAATGRAFRLLNAEGFRRLRSALAALEPIQGAEQKTVTRLHRKARRAWVTRLTRRYQSGSVTEAAALTGLVRGALPVGGIYCNVGHDNLSLPVMHAIRDAGLARAVLLHDAIPLDFPEFARPGTPEKFRAKLAASADADVLIFNSKDTGERIAHHLGDGVLNPCIAPLGVDLPKTEPPRTADGYFLCVGTIEPRKNHALLLDIWEGRFGPPPPLQLRIVGRRGWRNEAVFQRLDSGPAMGRMIFEDGTPDDAALARLLAGATAVLLPSFAEGYGLPVAEALAAGVPVIASDLPALRAVGGAVPEWLPPDKPRIWQTVLAEYASPSSVGRAAQHQRMRAWQPPSWAAHFAIVDKALETILVQAP